MRDYQAVSKTVSSLCEGETDVIAKMATICCELYNSLEGYDWVGFYRVVEPTILKIGPYQGSHGCLTIPFERGVCGACARTLQTQIISDVDAFDGHIACSASTKSEIVVPVFQSGKLIAVLDVDADTVDSFDENDKHALENILKEAFE